MTQRLLFLDIETAPTLAYVWSLRPDYIPLEMVEEPGRVVCFAARFYGDKRSTFYSEWDHGHDGMVQAMHDLLDEADTVVHFNGKTFDVPWMLAEILQAGLTPPSPFAQVDLYQQTKQFRLVSHKLQHVSTHLLKLEGKLSTGGFGLWRKVMAGDEKARRDMRRYNIQDVDLMVEMWDGPLFPYLKVPNANLFTGLDGCVKCGGQNLERRGFKRLSSGTYQQYRCNGCGGWSRATTRSTSTSLVSA